MGAESVSGKQEKGNKLQNQTVGPTQHDCAGGQTHTKLCNLVYLCYVVLLGNDGKTMPGICMTASMRDCCHKNFGPCRVP